MNNYYGIHNNPNGFDNFTSVFAGGLVFLAVLLVIVIIALLVLIIVSNCVMFSKAGEKWWKGLIPMYNSWVQIKIARLAWWWFLIFCVFTAIGTYNADEPNVAISILAILVSFNVNYNLAKKFGKTDGFAVLCTFLPFIGFPILAFGKSKYNKDAKVDENGIFSVK